MSIGPLLKKLRDTMWKDKGVDGDAQRLAQIVFLLFLKVFDFKEEERELIDDSYVGVIPEGYRWRDWANPEDVKDAKTGQALMDFVNNELFPVLRGQAIKDASGSEVILFSRDDEKARLVKQVMREATNYMKDGILLRQVINDLNGVDLESADDAHEFNIIYEEMLSDLQKNNGEFYTNRAITQFAIDHIDPRVGMTTADFAAGTGGFLVDSIKYQLKQLGDGDTEGYNTIMNSIKACEFKPLPYQLLVTNLILHGVEIPDVYPESALDKRLSDYTAADCVDRIAMNPPYGGMTTEADRNNFPVDMRSSESFDLFIQLIIKRLARNGKAVVVLPDGFMFGTDNIKVNIKKKLLSECNLHTVIRLPQSCFAPYTSIATNLLFFDKTGKTKETWFYRLDMPEGYKHFSKTKPMLREHFKPIDEWWNKRKEIKDKKESKTQTETWKAKKYTIEEIDKLGYNIDLCGYPVEEKTVLSPEETLDNFIKHKDSLEAELTNATLALEGYLNGDMNVELLNIASISKKLTDLNSVFPSEMKASILQAAMEGKLTEQLPKGEDDFADTHCGDEPFEIPDTWEWSSLQDLVLREDIGDGDWVLSNDMCIDSNNNLIQIGSIGYGEYVDKPFKHVDDDFFETNNCSELHPGDILLSRFISKNRLNACIVPELEGRLFTAVDVCWVKRNEQRYNNTWLMYCMLCPGVQSQIMSFVAGTTRKRISKTNLIKVRIPVPPLEEQIRIVEKLEALLPLCDETKAID